MALKDTASFELQNYKDLFIKAKADLGKLDKLVNSYDLFNYLVTINHLHDWVKEETGNDCARPVGGDLDLVRRLCGRSKHFKKRPIHPPTTVNTGYGMGRYGVGLYGVGEPSYLVTQDDGTEVPILDLCKSALQTWDDYLKLNGLI
jgi:hypothetical protein